MATATETVTPSQSQNQPQSQETSAKNAQVKMNFPKPPVFEDKHAEREYLKGRLAAAFRIFGKNGFDEGTHLSLPPTPPHSVET